MASQNNPNMEPENVDDSGQENKTEGQQPEPGFKPSQPFNLSDDNELDEVRKAMIQKDEERLQSEQPAEEQPPLSDSNELVSEEGAGLNSAEFNQRLQSFNLESEKSPESENTDFHSQEEIHPSTPSDKTPPFAFEDMAEFSDNENLSTLEKIRRGLVPSDTLRTIITDSTSDAEVIDICQELGVDWNVTPGTTRDEKVTYLVGYFKQDEEIIHQRPFIETSTPPAPAWTKAQDWHESDTRLQDLQGALNLPETPIRTSRAPFFSRFVADFEQSTPMVKGLTIALSVFAIILVLAITYLYFNFRNLNPAAPAPVANEHPFPTQVRLPGGWLFDLNVGTVKEGNWDPTEAEWLQGTEVCRLVSLPWNKQLDAVYQTISAGDPMFLTMSNKDLLGYKVESTKTISSKDLNSLVTGDSPCLVVVLTKKVTEDRQVIISTPSFTSGTVIVTVTSRPSQTQQP